jgi:hypothetical protein
LIARKFVAVSIVLVTVLGLGVFGLVLNMSDPLQVPPPPAPPDEDPEIVITQELESWAEVMYWQDFMPAIPEEGPPFYLIIWINVTNTGTTTVTDFDAVRTTVYFYNTSTPLVTLSLHRATPESSEIGPRESVVFEFTNDRETFYSPTIEEGAVLYSRVLIRWGNGSEMILTTPPAELLYTH